MFMVKEEIENTNKLLKVKMKISVKNFIIFFTASVVLFLCALIPNIVQIFNNKNPGLMAHNIHDFSLTFFIGIVIGVFIFMIIYRQENDFLSVVPQTNTSRFISSQLLEYIFVFVVGCVSLIMYLCNYAVFKLISVFNSQVNLVLNFDIGFVIVGFLTFIMYGFLVVAVLGLVGVIVRKFNYYAVIVFAIILSLAIGNLRWVINNFTTIFAFLIKEPVVFIFLLKGAAFWLGVTAVALAINYHTVYYKSRKKVSAAGVVFIGVVMFVTMLIFPAVMFFDANSGSSTSLAIRPEPSNPRDDDIYSYIRIDVSHLPKGSKLNVECNNVFLAEQNRSFSHNPNVLALFATGADMLDSLQGDTVVIRHLAPINKINDVDLIGYANPQLTAKLEGNTLYIDYTFDKAHVVFIPIWGFAKQFECYAGKNVLLENPWQYSTGNRLGFVDITVE